MRLRATGGRPAGAFAVVSAVICGSVGYIVRRFSIIRGSGGSGQYPVLTVGGRHGPLGLASGGLLALLVALGCSSTRVLSEGTVVVRFENPAETCDLDPSFDAPAEGCRLIDREAIMCGSFGVIDGVLFLDGCEAPAHVVVLDKQGTTTASL